MLPISDTTEPNCSTNILHQNPFFSYINVSLAVKIRVIQMILQRYCISTIYLTQHNLLLSPLTQ